MDILGLSAPEQEEDLPGGFIRMLDIPWLLGAEDRTLIQSGVGSPTTPSRMALTGDSGKPAISSIIRTPRSEGSLVLLTGH